jgi:hypothetical protein
MLTKLTDNELLIEFLKFSKEELENYQRLFQAFEDINSNDPFSSHLEAVEAVINLRNRR